MEGEDKMKWTNLKFLIKPLIILAAVGVVLLLLGAAWVFLLGRGCGDRPRSSAAQSGAAPPGWVAPREETPPGCLRQRKPAARPVSILCG